MDFPTLDCLAVETFAAILEHLDLTDTFHLRLTSSAICHLATQDTFKYSCRWKQLSLTEIHLQRFVHLARTSRLIVSSLHTLTLLHPDDGDSQPLVPPGGHRRSRAMGQARMSAEAKRRMEERRNATQSEIAQPQTSEVFARITELLGDAFRHLMVSQPGFQLCCLRLHVGEHPDTMSCEPPRWYSGPPAAVGKTFAAAMVALKSSRLPVRQLDLFCQRGYALGLDAFGALHGSIDSSLDNTRKSIGFNIFRPSLAPVQHLTIQFSEPASHGVITEPAIEADVRRSRNETYCADIQRLIHVPTDLLSLTLTFYSTFATPIEPSPTESLLRWSAARKGLNSLQKLSLSSFDTAACDLYHLLDGCSHSLSQLELRDIRMDTIDSIERLFVFCTDPSASPLLQRFNLKRLSEKRQREEDHPRWMVFTDEGLTYDTHWCDGTGPSPLSLNRCASTKISRSGADVRKPIGFLWWDGHRQAPVGQ